MQLMFYFCLMFSQAWFIADRFTDQNLSPQGYFWGICAILVAALLNAMAANEQKEKDEFLRSMINDFKEKFEKK